jgi:FSR family fosmidomycin resistance protein-like MFS transporter
VSEAKLDRRAITMLALGHAADDLSQSFLPALLPFLVSQRHLTFAAATMLILAQNLSSSLVQPAIGFLADKRPMPALIGFGILLAGAGVAVLGLLDSYAAMFVAVLISGIGAAAFHPEGARFANLASGAKKSSGVRWFSMGGTLGFMVGPTFATGALALWGIGGTSLALVPVTVMAILLWIEIPRLRTFLANAAAERELKPLPDDWSAFGRLVLFIVLRSIALIGAISILPLYFVHVVHVDAAIANLALTTQVAGGVLGTYVGGPAADRFGRRTILAAGGLLATIGLFGLSLASTPGIGIALGFLFAALVGFALNGVQPASIVLGQEYLPNRMGTASGLTLGLAFTLGGIFAPVLGTIGDRWGLTASILTAACVAVLSLLAALALPDPERRRALIAARQT